MEINIKEITGLVEGKVVGDGDLTIKNVARIEDAIEGDLTFLYLPQYEKYLTSTRASAVLIKPEITKSNSSVTYIEVDNPNEAFNKILTKYFWKEAELDGIDETSSIHPEAVLGKNVSVGKNVVISKSCIIGDNTKIFHNTVIMNDVSVGNNCLIYPNVTIREECKIGQRVIIHPGAVIGSDGFGFLPDKKGKFHKIPQIGNVVIEDDVEIGSNTTIDRAALGSTIIKSGVKLDNLIQIAHNCYVGENTVISAQAGISGSTKVGKNCMMGGQAGLTGHIELGDGVLIGAQSGVSKSILKSGTYFGYPAQELGKSLRTEAHIRKLPEYILKIRDLEKRLSSLEETFQKKK